MKARRGQAVLYLVMALVALMVLALANASAFLAVRAKNRAMNAGDAAALASARRQAELLNKIGRLNLEHAAADYVGDYVRSLEIVEEQRRLAFLGPLDCLRDAQVSARENGAPVSEPMTEILARHVADIRTKYMRYPELYPEPWEGAWAEYAAALAKIVADGICAGPENIDFVDAFECFPITAKSFYAAVAGRCWCKFVVAGWESLLDLDSHNMPPPVTNVRSDLVNSEICSLHLAVRPLPALPSRQAEEFLALLRRNGIVLPDDALPVKDLRPVGDPSRRYFVYDGSVWRPWTEMDPLSQYRFPVMGHVKPEFNVMGCTSVFRVIERIPRLLEESEVDDVWSAAAKPFGSICSLRESRVPVTEPAACGLVLPAYEAVRLVPLSAAYVGCQDVSTADKSWLDHVRDHVPCYLADGIDALPGGCPYCRVLVQWEDADFRREIAEWISRNGESCSRPQSGPGPAQGGTPYAH